MIKEMKSTNIRVRVYHGMVLELDTYVLANTAKEAVIKIARQHRLNTDFIETVNNKQFKAMQQCNDWLAETFDGTAVRKVQHFYI